MRCVARVVTSGPDQRDAPDRSICARPGALSVGFTSGLCQAPDNICFGGVGFGEGLFGALPERWRL